MNVLTILDNYDSFTYNLAQAFGGWGEQIMVWRNDEKSVAEILAEEPAGIIISPGPGTPAEAGIALELINEVKERAVQGNPIPLLGVCLGHQALASAYGSKIIRAPEIVHGKNSRIFHQGQGLFQGLEQGFLAGRYHSLMVEQASLDPAWEVTAYTEEGLIMGLQHRVYPFYGVQFHPESILTPAGNQILLSFLQVVREQVQVRKGNW